MAAEARLAHGGTYYGPNSPPEFRDNIANRRCFDLASGNAPYPGLPLCVPDLSLILHPRKHFAGASRACLDNPFLPD